MARQVRRRPSGGGVTSPLSPGLAAGTLHRSAEPGPGADSSPGVISFMSKSSGGHQFRRRRTGAKPEAMVNIRTYILTFVKHGGGRGARLILCGDCRRSPPFVRRLIPDDSPPPGRRTSHRLKPGLQTQGCVSGARGIPPVIRARSARSGTGPRPAG